MVSVDVKHHVYLHYCPPLLLLWFSVNTFSDVLSEDFFLYFILCLSVYLLLCLCLSVCLSAVCLSVCLCVCVCVVFGCIAVLLLFGGFVVVVFSR